jgi:hypothetical protein
VGIDALALRDAEIAPNAQPAAIAVEAIHHALRRRCDDQRQLLVARQTSVH